MSEFPKIDFISNLEFKKYFTLFQIYANSDMREVVGYIQEKSTATDIEAVYDASGLLQHRLSDLLGKSISINIYAKELVVNPSGTIEIGNNFILDGKFQYVFSCENKKVLHFLTKQIQKIHKELLQ